MLLSKYCYIAILGGRRKKGQNMKKNILSVIISLVMCMAVCVPVNAAEISTKAETVSIENEVVARAGYLINEGGYLSSSNDYYTFANNSTVYPTQQFTIIVNFRSSNGGTARLTIGDAFNQTIPCDGVSRAYHIETSFYDGPIVWQITNQPGALAYSVRMYQS